MTAAANPSDPVGPNVRIKRRRWYVAALLTIFWPGLGQLYNGQLRRALCCGGILLGILVVAVTLTHWVGSAFAVTIAFIVLVAVAIVLWFIILVDAAWQARHLRQIPLRRFNRVWVYLLIICGGFLLGEITPISSGAKSYSLPGGSMIPTGWVGDIFVAEKDYFLRDAPERGELAVFKLPSDPRIDYIKRVVGLPGDTIQMIGGRLHINGVAVKREQIEVLPTHFNPDPSIRRIPHFIETLPNGRRYRIREERGDDGMLDNTSLYLVPADHYFVLGDNRDNSQDSRVLAEVGFVPRANFRDRPAYIYWSRDPSRFGRRLE